MSEIKLPPFKPGREPKFDAGDTAWVIQKRTAVRQVVLAVHFSKVVGENEGERFLITTGYYVAAWNLRSGDNNFSPREIYDNEAEAERLAAWCPIVGITKDQRLAAFGDRMHDATLDTCELYRCCPDVSTIRSRLITALENRGMIQRDVEQLRQLINRHTCPTDPAPNLNAILAQLGLAWPGKAIEG